MQRFLSWRRVRLTCAALCIGAGLWLAVVPAPRDDRSSPAPVPTLQPGEVAA